MKFTHRVFRDSTRGSVTLLITEKPVIKIDRLEKVTGRNILIETAIRDVFVNWLSNQPVAVAADVLGVSAGFVGKLRTSLGIASTYTGESKTTRWRRRK